MKETLEKLWNEYLIDEGAVINTAEERNLTKEAVELHKKVNLLLNEDQKCAVEKYIDVLLDIEALFVKKAFVKGCEFSISFLLESGNFKK